MSTITVTLTPEAMGLLPNPNVPPPTFEFPFDEVDIDDPEKEDPLLLELVSGICNSYPDEMLVAPGYREVVAAYRDVRHRSLSVGDLVTITDNAGPRTYRVAREGFERVSVTV